ncbi:uncharacterized protein C7orf50 homolog isoform X1 [Cyanistes caeruleus]|uniref:WKF domain-containing protein n=1 Tax=Cyanistes caeruleus TaxID=156563 RepID=A0A8C0VKL4_CYACU|nr:uncharacterized protein C7orf50 homolog isoform X1 [Cyanistes caeruleus]
MVLALHRAASRCPRCTCFASLSYSQVSAWLGRRLAPPFPCLQPAPRSERLCSELLDPARFVVPGFRIYCLKSTGVQATKEEEELIAEEELTPEEKRKLERKLKKERKKKEKQLMREAGIPIKKVQPKKPSGSERALAYLTSWSKNPEKWKFQKTRQTWLLLHMYDKEKVPDKYFPILLDYLQGLQGGARDKTVQKAEAFMKEFDSSDGEDPNLLEKCERIRQVLQLLS